MNESKQIEILHLITEIYHSEFPADLKHDIICRVIAKAIDANVVTIFSYSGNEDKLNCTGGHIHKYDALKEGGQKYKSIINNIEVFEYCKYYLGENLKKEITYNKYKNNKAFRSEKVNKEKFDRIAALYLGPDEDDKSYEKQRYVRLKEKIHQETYNIDDKYPTSSMYRAVLKGNIEPSVSDVNDLKAGMRKCHITYENLLGVEISTSSIYIGLPLAAGNSTFGIVRILFGAENDHVENKKIKSTSKLFFDGLSQILSLHFKVQYLFEGYKSIARAELIDLVPTSLNNECDILSEVLNSYGVIIRLKTNENQPPKIVGHSKQMGSYIDWIGQSGDFYVKGADYNETLLKLFYQPDKKQHEDNNNILATKLKFHISKVNAKINEQTFYYLDDFELKEVDDINKINVYPDAMIDFNELFSGKMLSEVTYKFSFREIVILKIPKVEGSLATFVSSKNRSFTKSDIELMHAVLQKIGYEIKHLVDEEINVKKSQRLSTLETTELIIHQLTAPINAVEQLAISLIEMLNSKNTNERKFEFLNKYLPYLKNKTLFAKSQIKSIEKFLQWENAGIQAKFVAPYRLVEYLKKCTHIYRDMAASKGLQIFVFEDNDDFLDQINFDQGLFNELINCMVDNAVKYSYYSSELLSRGIDFDPKNVASDGHIQIGVSSTKDLLVLKFINWGNPIDEDEHNAIFKFRQRGKHAHVKTTAGSGIGLYMVKKIADALSGTITVTHVHYKTTFTIKFAKI